jgi:hypothetical protein
MVMRALRGSYAQITPGSQAIPSLSGCGLDHGAIDRLWPVGTRTLICCGAESDEELGIDLKGESRHLTLML